MTTKSSTSLYPFLDDSASSKTPDRNAMLHAIQTKAADSISTKEAFFAEHSETLFDTAMTLARCYRNGGKLFTMGNGGSSCDASHLAVEFQHPVTAGRPALPAVNLCHDIALMTALGNDVGFDVVFSRQIEAHAHKGDTLVAFSTSGNSSNLLRALEHAREKGLYTIAILGGSGGEIQQSKAVDHCLTVASESIHRIQEVHVACYHILWDITHSLLANHRGALAQSTTEEES